MFGFKQFQYGTKNFHIAKVAGASRGEAQNGKFFFITQYFFPRLLQILYACVLTVLV